MKAISWPEMIKLQSYAYSEDMHSFARENLMYIIEINPKPFFNTANSASARVYLFQTQFSWSSGAIVTEWRTDTIYNEYTCMQQTPIHLI